MEQGLAAASAGVTSKYGSGEGQNTKHYYAGTVDSKSPKKKKSCKKKSK